MSDGSLTDGGGHVPLAVTTRSGVDESVHHGSVVALDEHGHELFVAGDPSRPMYPRSALKPLQAEAMLRCGLDVGDQQLALVCASHDGTDRHCEIVRSILEGVGLDESALGNVPGLPIDDRAAAAHVRSGAEPTPLRMNCSGKHAGMVATCVANGWPIDGYLDETHPLQVAITHEVARRTGAVHHVGVDGCGAPAHHVTLHGLAGAFAAIAAGAGRAPTAMRTYPDLVGGEHRFVTMLMRAVPGLFAKDGAEGVFAAAFADGRALAVKVADGNQRAVPAVTLAALAAMGIDERVLDVGEMSSPVLGHGRPVGTVRAVVALG